jgi:hypothetical protein
LAALAFAWIMVMLPAMIRARDSAPLIAAKRWRRRMNLISPRPSNAGRWVVVNSTHCNAHPRFRLALVQRRRQRRRRRLLLFLVLAAAASGAYAALRGGPWLEINLAIDAVLGLYLIGLRETTRRQLERTRKVRPIAARRRHSSREEVSTPLSTAGGRRG